MFKIAGKVGLVSRAKESLGLLSEMMRGESGSFGVKATGGLEAAW